VCVLLIISDPSRRATPVAFFISAHGTPAALYHRFPIYLAKSTLPLPKLRPVNYNQDG
jgi:hypothetical protein